MIVRVLLDTCAVRKLLHRDNIKLDVQLIQRHQKTCKVSVAGPAFAELTEQLMDGRLRFDTWSSGVGELDSILDPRWPLFPSGKQLAYLAGTQANEPFDLAFEQAHLKAVWYFLRQADSVDFLTKKAIVFLAPNGQQYKCDLTKDRLDSVMTKERCFWVRCVRNIQRLAVAAGEQLEEKTILRRMKADLGTAPDDAPDLAERLDATSRMLARLYGQALADKNPYNPEGQNRQGDSFDLDLLFAIPLPAVIVTADEKFLNRLRGTKAPHHQQVCLIPEFHDHLRNGTLPSLVSDFRTPEDQFGRWQKAAYSGWEKRGHPIGDDLADWFACEPMA